MTKENVKLPIGDITPKYIDQLACQIITTIPLIEGKVRALDTTSVSIEITDYLSETIKFLFLCANSKRSLSPSKIVDNTWHEFILFTRTYSKFCHTHFDSYIHHEPGDKPQKNFAQYHETLHRYEIYFGSPLELFWPRPLGYSNCGSCEN